MVITTFNEERHIGACLESLLWGDEILVIDSYSTDKTPEIVKGFAGVTFIQRTYYGSAAQKNWAMDQCQNEWILIFDADERCTPELRHEIEQLLAQGPMHDAYTIRRKVFFLGKEIRFSGWQRDQVIRLLKKGAGRYPNRRVHADMKTRGPAPLLRHRMDHYMVEDFFPYALRIAKYSHWGGCSVLARR
ncbi:MAG: glycosyltransferase family 2 protein, partial [Leptolyngbyaceae cyanobacterium CSU_1_4]|nr:glycosyltransferase family 2 protein [Leptolyngbyaceae cyanobacterium CSU_1_4]